MRLNFQNEWDEIRSVFGRFPIAGLCSVLFCALCIYVSETSATPDDWIARTLITLVYAFFTSIGLTLLAEQNPKQRRLCLHCPLSRC